MCSDRVSSVLLSSIPNDIMSFKWNKLMDEMRLHAPTLLCLLECCTATKGYRIVECKAVIGLCTAILCKYRRERANILQKIISLILYSGHSSKQVFIRLQKLMLYMSFQSTINLVDKLGIDYDKDVLCWRDELMDLIHVQEPSQPSEIAVILTEACM